MLLQLITYQECLFVAEMSKHVSNYVIFGVKICDDSRKAISQALVEEMKNLAF
jgi:hypothetical protein